MQRRLTQGFVMLATAVAFAACSSNDSAPISVGPNFPSQSLYASNSTQNAVSIYPPGTKSGSGPSYQIGGGSTTLNGPQYLAFDASSNLWSTNWTANGTGTVVEIKALATGNVLPLFSSGQFGITFARPRGLAFGTSVIGSTSSTFLVLANVDPSYPAGFTSQLVFLNPSTIPAAPYQRLAGPLTGLSVPSGVATDTKGDVYAANLQGASVTEYVVPTASPTPVPTSTPTATPVPTPTPIGATPSPTPTPAPTATPLNVAPNAVISGPATGVTTPAGITLDGSGNIYVADQGNASLGIAPAILVFSGPISGTVSGAPASKIQGAATLLVAPTDVKLDSTGQIYVSDQTSAGAGVVHVYAAHANGNVAPTTTYTSPGAVLGIALTP